MKAGFKKKKRDHMKARRAFEQWRRVTKILVWAKL
jgi:hypothetical protein